MNIHVISSLSHSLSEGVNNIASHYISCLSKHNKVTRCSLKKTLFNMSKIKKADFVMVFLKLNKITYSILRFISRFNKNIFAMVCQPCETGFTNKYNKKPFPCYFFYLEKHDIENINGELLEKKEFPFLIGVDFEKFKTISPEKQKELKIKYGYDPSKKLILHVGHCTKGRGLQAFNELESIDSTKVFVDSGLYKDETVLKELTKLGVNIVTGYQNSIEEFYQMADIYFFPTTDTNYVVSQPLSIIEALSCGTPALINQSFDFFNQNTLVNKQHIHIIDVFLKNPTKLFSEKSFSIPFVDTNMDWNYAVNHFIDTIKGIKYEN